MVRKFCEWVGNSAEGDLELGKDDLTERQRGNAERNHLPQSHLKKRDGAKQSLRVLFLSMYDPYVVESGPGAHLRGLSQSLSKLGCEVHILVLASKNNDRVVNGVQMHYLDAVNIPVARDCIARTNAFREVERLRREHKIDIIHGQSPASYGYGLLRRDDIPFVVTIHGSFGEFLSYFGVPPSFINPIFIYNAMSEMLSTFLLYIECKCADKVIAVSKATAEETIRFYRLPEEHVVTIYNGIDLSSFTDLRPEEKNQDHTILSVGRLSWRKGYKYLIDAMPNILSEYPNAKLLLVGDVATKNVPLQYYVKKIGVEDSVSFLGKVSAERLYSLYHHADVYVQPSLYEPLGITVLEAMSMGKPIVATRVGGIPELITDGVEGLLVDPANSQQLARAITKVFSDLSCRRRLGNNARERVEREFTWEAIAKKTFEFYTNLLNDK